MSRVWNEALLLTSATKLRRVKTLVCPVYLGTHMLFTIYVSKHCHVSYELGWEENKGKVLSGQPIDY